MCVVICVAQNRILISWEIMAWKGIFGLMTGRNQLPFNRQCHVINRLALIGRTELGLCKGAISELEVVWANKELNSTLTNIFKSLVRKIGAKSGH